MFEARIAALLANLERAHSVPGSDSWFGVRNHHFRLNPPIAEPDLLAFETHHGIRLPEDYRDFLLLAGHGGAGPFYGIEPLSTWDQWFEEEAESPGYLASLCPLLDNAAIVDACKAAAARDARMAQGKVVPGAAPSDSWKHLIPENWSEWGRGTIHLCDRGCTFSARLIVSGASRGRIVYLDAQLWYPPYFVRDVCFLDWYEHWLSEVLSGRDPGDFAFDQP